MYEAQSLEALDLSKFKCPCHVLRMHERRSFDYIEKLYKILYG